MAELVAMVDGRCFCDKCEARTTSIYRMVGFCWNCKADPILMIFRAGDKANDLDCPVCGVYQKVHPQRLATPDEIPAAVVGRHSDHREGSE